MKYDILLYLFVSSAGIQLFFWIIWFSRLVFYKKKNIDEPVKEEGVSVIICARNELENLKNLLPKIYEQDYSQFEVIVVNDRSADESFDYLRIEEQRQSLLEVVHIEHSPDHIQSKKYAIMLGVKKAKYDLILLTDADCYPASNQWIKSMSSCFTEKIQIVLGYSQYEKRKGILNSFIRFETFYTGLHYVSAALAKMPYMGVGRNLAYRKSLFLEVNGFSGYEKTMGGDDDLFVNKNSTRKNTSVCIGIDSVVYSYPKSTIGALYKQKLRHLSIGKHYKGINKTTLGILSLSHILFWLSFIILASVAREPIWLLFGIIGRFAFISITFIPASKKLGDKISWWNLALLDLLFVGYYVVTGIPALFSKRVKWR